MTAQGTSHEVGKDVPCPHQQQQIQKQERPRPLVAQLLQKSERQSDVPERKRRSHRSGKLSARVNPLHCNREKNKWSHGGGESRAVNEARGREQRLVAPRID